MAAITPIVTVNTSITTAPIPNSLQQRGALISQGGTTAAEGSLTLLESPADLVPIAAAPIANSTLVLASGTVTVTTATPHGWTNAETVEVVIAGAAPAAYNGKVNATITGTSTYTFPLAGSPGSNTTPGTTTLYSKTELSQMVNTYFGGNGVPAIYVLELGEGTPADGVAALAAFIIEVAGTTDALYGYLVPREWDALAQFLSLILSYNAPNKKLYFWVTTTLANRAVYSGPAYKNVFAMVESPVVDINEFSCAAPFGTALKQNPSSTNKVPPMSYSPAFAVTPYPVRGNQVELSELADDSVNWIGTGAEGGISTAIVFQGKMSDGNFWNFWYSVDWAQINMDLALANEVINGSATSINPLYYNQDGINRLQNRAAQVAAQGVGYGLGNGQIILTKLPIAQFLQNYNNGDYAGQIVINAEPFLTYARENPSDYGQGRYAGIACIWIPQLNFLNIIFDLQASTLITG